MAKKRKLIFEYEEEIIKALNYTNKTDCDYIMGIDITVYPQRKEALGFAERRDPTYKKYRINFRDKEYNDFWVTFEYSYNCSVDYFEILDIRKRDLREE